MNKRIKVIDSYIDNDDMVLDIGCDQALLSELLAKRGLYSYASDIRKNIVDNAHSRIQKLKLDKYVTFIVSDGLKNVNNDEIDTLVLSGMGTITILNILKDIKKPYKKIITISNNKHDELRKNMLLIGYKILKEEIIYEKNKFYNLIVFVPGKCEYSKEDIYIGKNHQNKKLLIKKLKFEISKIRKNYSLNKDESLGEKIKIIEKMLMCH